MENMNLEVWPFLVSRNKQLGYRPVVAPDFLVNTKSTTVLSDAAGGDITRPGYIMCRQIHNTKEGDLTVIFRVTDATNGKDLLRDAFGRPITWIAGFVLQGRVDNITITEEQFEEIYALISTPFHEFWQADTDFKVIPSQPLTLKNPTSTAKEYKLISIDPHIIVQRYPSAKKTVSKPGQPIDWNQKHVFRIGATIQSVVLNPREPIVAILMGHAQSVTIFNYVAKERIGPFNLRNSSSFGAIRFTPDGKYMGIVDNSPYISLKTKNQVWLWDIKKQKNHIHTKVGEINRIWDIDFSSDRRFLACGGDEGYLYLWGLLTNEWEATILAHRESTTCVRFSRDNSAVATASKDGTIALWRISEGRLDSLIPRLDTHENAINQIEFSPKGNILASASDDGTVRLWDWQRSDEVAVFSKHKAAVKTISFSPDGRILASAGQDNVIYVWDVHSQEIVSTLTGHTADVLAVAFSPDGYFLFSGGVDKSLIWWEREDT